MKSYQPSKISDLSLNTVGIKKDENQNGEPQYHMTMLTASL